MKLILAFLAAGIAWAQPLSVYSDLAEIDSTGKVTAPETPREILSPVLVRNGFTSFQVVVQAPADTKWWLFVGQNPEDAVKVTLYRELRGQLEPVELPWQSSGTAVLWMDLWTDRNAPVARIKVEPELLINDDWTIYPIEGRVTEARLPEGPRIPGDSAPVEAIRPYLCSPGGVAGSALGPRVPSVPTLRYRNVQQDLALAWAGQAYDALKKLFGPCDAPAPSDPEWYLRIRDYLYRLR